MRRTPIFLRALWATLLASVWYTAAACIAFAQTTQNGFVPLQKLEDSSQLQGIYSSTTDLSTFLNRIFLFAVILGAILAVGRLAYAGWLYMLGDNYGSTKKAKDIIGNVVIGLLLLLSIWLILNQINPCLLNLDILSSFSNKGGATCTYNGATPTTPGGGNTPTTGGSPTTPKGFGF